MRFSSPVYLALLSLLPVLFYLGRSALTHRHRRGRIALGIRSLIVLALVLAVSGFELVSASRSLGVVFVVDASDSMTAGSGQRAAEWIGDALQGKSPEDQAAVILFGETALVDRPLSADAALAPFSSAPGGAGTDLASALLLAEAVFPGNLARRIVLISDGRETRGDALSTARRLGEQGVDLLIAPVAERPDGETLIQDVVAPRRLIAGENFDLILSIEASQNTAAQVRVFENESLVAEQSLNLTRGLHAYRLPLRAGETGFLRYRVLIDPQVDTAPQNNRLAAYTFVDGAPRILVIAPPSDETLPGSDQTRGDEAGALVTALQAASYDVERNTPAGLPADLAALSRYGAVILVDVPARNLISSQMDAVQAYVRDLGGGLLVVGGPTSFGVGGYFRTPLEETLPLSMAIQDELRRPTLTMVFVIDRSGSMSDQSLGANKLEMAKEAAARAVSLLQPQDRVGVVAFDDVATWVVQPAELGDAGQVIAAIGAIRSGGGTDILAGLQAVADRLPGDPGTLKHVILLTDGGADPTGLFDLAAQLRLEHDITLTTIGIGQDAAAFLPRLAEAGGGRYHFTSRPESIPAIFTEETTLASRSYIVEGTFEPQRRSNSPLVEGYPAFPRLYGYVATSGKDAAEVLLAAPAGDPLLATWRYGLGKAAAFTSDVGGRWGREWVPWDGFGRFWAGAVRWALQEGDENTFQASIALIDGQARIELDALAAGGETLNLLEVEANLIRPDLQTETLPLVQQGPGRYTASFLPDQEGAYLIRLTGSQRDGEGEEYATTLGWVQSYSPEYGSQTSEATLLARIVADTPARYFTQDPAGIFNRDLPAPVEVRPAAPWLLLAAILLLPLDIALRRLVFRGDEITRLSKAIRARLPRPPGARRPDASDPSDAVRAFREIKELTRQGPMQPEESEATVALQVDAGPIEETPDKGPPADEAMSSSRAARPAEEQPTDTTAARLLAEKRRKRRKPSTNH
jgi:uncharacterized membrane protein